MEINEIVKRIHTNAVNHGWWYTKRELPEIIALCHSELSEALEEFRKGHSEIDVYYDGEKPEGVPIEMIDCVIRVFDFLGYYNLDVEKLIKLKHEYNKKREYMHGKRL